MSEFAPITDAQLAQTRQDPAFHRRVLADHLEHLLLALNALRAADEGSDPVHSEQIREGVTLAMHLSNILHRLGKA